MGVFLTAMDAVLKHDASLMRKAECQAGRSTAVKIARVLVW